jgi:hypothetical protein
MRPLILALGLGCAPEEEPVDLRDPPAELPLPDVDPAAIEAAAADALALVIALTADAVWPAHVDAVAQGAPGCPDLYVGPHDLEARALGEGGWSWADLCVGPEGRRYAGFTWWDGSVSREGDASSPVGATLEGSRRLVADGLVAQGEDVLLELDGELSDSLLRVDAPDLATWTHSSRVEATLGGTWLDGLAPGGLRAGLVSRLTGGGPETIELRGDLHLFEHRLQGVFDSVAVDLAWAAPDASAPDACAAEPAGWIGLRDEDAAWIELVFQPRHGDATGAPYDNPPYDPCDGCATVFVRGIEQDLTVCPDLGFVWEGALAPPDPAGFAVDPRALLTDGGAP